MLEMIGTAEVKEKLKQRTQEALDLGVHYQFPLLLNIALLCGGQRSYTKCEVQMQGIY